MNMSSVASQTTEDKRRLDNLAWRLSQFEVAPGADLGKVVALNHERWAPQPNLTIPPTTTRRVNLDVMPMPATQRRQQQPPSYFKVVTASTVKPVKIEWLWRGRYAKGKLGSLLGDPGMGKTTILASLIADLRFVRTLYEAAASLAIRRIMRRIMAS